MMLIDDNKRNISLRGSCKGPVGYELVGWLTNFLRGHFPVGWLVSCPADRVACWLITTHFISEQLDLVG